MLRTIGSLDSIIMKGLFPLYSICLMWKGNQIQRIILIETRERRVCIQNPLAIH